MAMTQVDTANPTNTDIITILSEAVTGGTIYSTIIRNPAGGFVGIAQSFVSAGVSLPGTKLTLLNATTGTLAAGVASGAEQTYILSSNATPGSQAMRTPAQILADTPGLSVGSSYSLRIINSGAGTFTLATDSGTGFTLSGTVTVAQNVWRDYVVTLVTGTTGMITEVGNGTYS